MQGAQGPARRVDRQAARASGRQSAKVAPRAASSASSGAGVATISPRISVETTVFANDIEEIPKASRGPVAGDLVV